MPLHLIPYIYLLCWNLISDPKRDQFETLDTFPACLPKQGTFCTKYGFISKLLVRYVTNLRLWSSQLSISVFQVQIPLCVTCNFTEEGKKSRKLLLDYSKILCFLLIYGVKWWLKTFFFWGKFNLKSIN